ncbi:hypothetical protein AIOGIFDO_00689 [Candidatus Methanoperedenaceae archaeon GB37]|nr:hypothetical protein AIOGIFDO_00689 [Candidatus Methanoperedenaceae archaeon GB37]
MKTKEAIEEFKKEIKKLYGNRLKHSILYGSETKRLEKEWNLEDFEETEAVSEALESEIERC